MVPYVSSVRPAMEIPTAPLEKYLENILGAQAKGTGVDIPILHWGGVGGRDCLYLEYSGVLLLCIKPVNLNGRRVQIGAKHLLQSFSLCRVAKIKWREPRILCGVSWDPLVHVCSS